MVYITSEDGKEKKFACIKCIKGHRSSKCSHANRELFEIKKKGRPVSQCDTCRQLRKTRQIHIKCMCHLDVSVKDGMTTNSSSSNSPIIDKGFRYSDLSLISNNTASSSTLSPTTPGSCAQCDRPTLYCICSKDNINAHHQFESSNNSKSQQELGGYMSSGSSDGSITPPVYQLSYPERLVTSAGLNNSSSNNTPSPTTPTTTKNPNLRHLTIPIHDPSDDIDSDTPIYKSQEESVISDKTAVLGKFTNTSSEELMNQIYSGFIDTRTTSSSTSSSLLREADHQLAELSKDD